MEYKKKKNLLSHALPQGIPSLRSAKKSRNIILGWSIDCTVLQYDRRAPGYGIASSSSCSRSVPSRPRQAPLSSPIASVKFVTLYGNRVPVSSRAYVIVFFRQHHFPETTLSNSRTVTVTGTCMGTLWLCHNTILRFYHAMPIWADHSRTS
jgi:hypothetical protein